MQAGLRRRYRIRKNRNCRVEREGKFRHVLRQGDEIHDKKSKVQTLPEAIQN